jgi:hypothetical protein
MDPNELRWRVAEGVVDSACFAARWREKLSYD